MRMVLTLALDLPPACPDGLRGVCHTGSSSTPHFLNWDSRVPVGLASACLSQPLSWAGYGRSLFHDGKLKLW